MKINSPQAFEYSNKPTMEKAQFEKPQVNQNSTLSSAVIFDLSPQAIAAIEKTNNVRGDTQKPSPDNLAIFPRDPLPPGIVRNRSGALPPPFANASQGDIGTQPEPIEVTKGKSDIQNSPGVESKDKNQEGKENTNSNSTAFRARLAINENPELGDQPFGKIVSLIARGLPLPIENEPEDVEGEIAIKAPTEELVDVPWEPDVVDPIDPLPEEEPSIMLSPVNISGLEDQLKVNQLI